MEQGGQGVPCPGQGGQGRVGYPGQANGRQQGREYPVLVLAGGGAGGTLSWPCPGGQVGAGEYSCPGPGWGIPFHPPYEQTN